MAHQYKSGDVATVFQISASNELVIEGKATIRKRVADVDEQYRVEFANKPSVTYERFVDSWAQEAARRSKSSLAALRNGAASMPSCLALACNLS
jgi:hypothetical protein